MQLILFYYALWNKFATGYIQFAKYRPSSVRNRGISTGWVCETIPETSTIRPNLKS